MPSAPRRNEPEFTDQAISDLDRIEEFISQDNPQTARGSSKDWVKCALPLPGNLTWDAPVQNMDPASAALLSPGLVTSYSTAPWKIGFRSSTYARAARISTGCLSNRRALELFLAAANGSTGEETALEAMTPPPILGQRKYRRTPKPRAPGTGRRRPDPFQNMWNGITQRFSERPELTARLILDQLQKKYRGSYPDKQLRRLQRRVKEWRAGALIQFDDAWLGEEELAGMTLPYPLRASVEENIEQPLDSMAGVRS